MTTSMPITDELEVLQELESVAEANLERHLSIAKEWMPHEYVPWSEGRGFDELPWAPEQSRLPDAAAIAFEVNLLTEDNLPSYHREIAVAFGRDGAWGTWVNRWTAEEGRHAIAMRDYLLVTRGVDPVELERGRMLQMEQGYDSGQKSPLEVIAYVSFQELATRISHRNTGTITQDPIAEKLLTRIATDENLHMVFYRDLVAGALKAAPSLMVKAVARELLRFQMPGAGIVGFEAKAREMAKAGVYNLRIHRDEVISPILRAWKIFELEGLDAEGEQARNKIERHLNTLDRLASRQEAVLAQSRAADAEAGK